MLIREQIGSEMCPGWGNIAIGEQIGPEMCPEWENVAIGEQTKRVSHAANSFIFVGQEGLV